jgi:hypothetical protein
MCVGVDGVRETRPRPPPHHPRQLLALPERERVREKTRRTIIVPALRDWRGCERVESWREMCSFGACVSVVHKDDAAAAPSIQEEHNHIVSAISSSLIPPHTSFPRHLSTSLKRPHPPQSSFSLILSPFLFFSSLFTPPSPRQTSARPPATRPTPPGPATRRR